MGRSPVLRARSRSAARSPDSQTTVPRAWSASTRPSWQGSPPPVAMTSPRLRARSRTASSSRARKCGSPFAVKISGMGRPSLAVIMSSVSTKQRPSRLARSRPTEDLPAPMNPTRITLSLMPPAIVTLRLPDGLSVHRGGGGSAAIVAVAHPAPPALREVVIHARLGPDAYQNRDALAGDHDAGVIEGHIDGQAGAEAKERDLLRGVPTRIAWADSIGDPHARRDRRLTEEVVDVFRQAFHRGRADAVEHHRQRELSLLPQLSHAIFDGAAHRADPRPDRFECPPQSPDLGDVELFAARLDHIGALPCHFRRAVDGARLHERLAQGQRLVEKREHGRIRDVAPLLVALEAQDFVGIHAEGQAAAVEGDGNGRADVERRAHGGERRGGAAPGRRRGGARARPPPGPARLAPPAG